MTMFGAMHGGGGTLSLKAESLDPRTWMQQQQAIPQMQDQPGLVDFFNLKGLSSISSAHRFTLLRNNLIDFEVSQRLGLRFYRFNSIMLFWSPLHVHFSAVKHLLLGLVFKK